MEEGTWSWDGVQMGWGGILLNRQKERRSSQWSVTIRKAGGLEAYSEHRISRGCESSWSTKAAAKSLQSCPTLCDPIDGSPPGSTVLGILQARTLEWVAISFSNAWKWKVKVNLLSRVRPLETPWTTVSRWLLLLKHNRYYKIIGFILIEIVKQVIAKVNDHLSKVLFCFVLFSFCIQEPKAGE